MHDARADAADRDATEVADVQGRWQDLPPAWQRLLKGPAYAPPPTESTQAPPSDGRLGLFLDLQTVDSGLATLDVAPVLLSRDADGEPLQAEAIGAEAPPLDDLSEPEAVLLKALLALPQSLRKNRTYVHIGQADAVVEQMLAHASCFLGGIAGFRLRRGPARPARWQWRVGVTGDQRLLPTLTEGRHVLQAGRLWYVDPDSSRIGPIVDPLASMGLAEAPALTPPHAATVAAAWSDSKLAAHAPPPRVFDPPTALDCSPDYCLTLQALGRHARQAAGMPPLAWARLAFDYGGVRVSAVEKTSLLRRVRGDKLVEIQRHRAEELAALERLESQGLVLAVDCEGLPWELAELLPEDAWLFPGTGYAGALEVNTPARWLGMRARLEPEGFAIEYAASFPFELLDEPPQWYVRAVPDRKQRSYRLDIGVLVHGKRVNLLPAVAAALAEGQFDLAPTAGEPADACWFAPLDDRRRMPLRLDELRPLLQPVADYLASRRRVMRLPWGQAGRLEELAKALPEGGSIEAPPRLQGLVGRLRAAAGKAEAKAPQGFVGTLRGYQLEGLRWLNALARAGLGGILADDMGLGKTVQALAHVLALKQSGQLVHPVLVVAPTSLLPNWESEIARYAPGLACVTVHGSRRDDKLRQVVGKDLILTSYALLPRDLKYYRRHHYTLLVLDEAQQVKNPRTQARRAAAVLQADRCVCLTGTPLENHLGELWSQLDLAVPGLLGNEHGFRANYRNPIEKYADPDCQARLNARIAPFIVRRTKAEVARELPPKTEITRPVVLEGRQRRLYDRLRIDLAEELREVIAEQGIERSGIVVLDALLKLRQTCCDPRLLKDVPGKRAPSAKFELLMQMLPELIAEGRRILVFSQFRQMLDLIAAELDRQGVDYVELTGQTRDRAAPVERFQSGEVPLFLLSLKAGGVGLNLTAADTVIHYDPWWNPAAEAQASDRAHRIGQDKPVFVYRLICADTVEERIEALKARKAELAAAVLAGGSQDGLNFSEQDLDLLLASD